jgi:hypothetical protein
MGRHSYTGQVLRIVTPKSVIVLFDGKKTPSQMASDWLERDRDW